MTRRKRIQPDIRVIGLSRLHIMAVCIILLIILNCPYGSGKTALKLNLPTSKHSTRKMRMANMEEKINSWKREQRHTTTFELTGDTTYDKLTLCAIEYDVRQLRRDYDLSRFIKIHFNPECTYGQFVKLNSMVKIQNQGNYAYEGDDFYVWIERERY